MKKHKCSLICCIKNQEKQFLRTIKTIICLLFVTAQFSFAGTANLQDVKVSIVRNNVRLEKVLNEIESQTDYLFFYNDKLVDVDRLVTLNVKNKPLQEVLSILFRNTDIRYTVEKSHIVLTKIGKEPKESTSPQKNKISLGGTVIFSSDNQPAPEVTVSVEGTTIGTITDVNGQYVLSVPASAKEVAFSYIGCITKKINVKDVQLFKLVSLDESPTSLKEVVAVAFGTQKKESLVGAVQTIKPSELIATSSNFTTAFAGKVAGVIATQSSGQPGADGANYWIRGISTFGSNSSPLIILDGVEIVNEMLNSLAPESIESFSILKDATATALYGSRGANGVMIITTKSGSNMEKMNVNFRVQSGISKATSIPEVADGVTYMNMYNEAYGRNFYSQEKIDGTKAKLDPYVYPNNNWYDLMFKNHTFNQNANINVTGGTKKVDYFLNAAINNENGILRDMNEYGYNTNVGLQKFSFQSNVSAAVTPTTRVSVKMNNMLQYSHLPYEDVSNLFYYTMRCNPVGFPVTLPAEKGDDFIRFGNAPSWDGAATDYNPVALMSRGYGDRYTSYLTTVFNVEQDLRSVTKGLKARFMASFYNKTYASSYRYHSPFYYKLDSYNVDDEGVYTYNTSEIGAAGTKYLSTSVGRDGHREYSLQGSLEYDRSFNEKHDVNALLVYHQKERVYNTPDANEFQVLPYREQGLAGRLTYGYMKKYLMELNFGYNGSENFSPGHRWGFFPSVALGWNVSKESFFASISDKITLLKIRGSYGKAGNDALADRFPYITTVLTDQALQFFYGSELTQAKGSTIDIIGQEDATWEVSEKLNVGLELGLYNDLTLILDAFKDNRTGIFMQRRSIPTSAGYTGTTPYGNIGAVVNKGFDASLEYNKIFSKDFILSLRGTFTYAHNKVTARDEDQASLIYPYKSAIGHPINTIVGYVADGLFKDEADIAESTPQKIAGETSVKPGDIKYVDLNHDNVIDKNDVKPIGDPTSPEIVYGFGPSIKYKKYDFSFFLQGTAKVSLLMKDMHPFVSESNSGFGLSQWIADNHWSESNQDGNAEYPRLSTAWNLNNTPTSTFWIRNGSFLRLKSLEMGYTHKKMRVYMEGTNLFILSGFNHWDPEKGSGNGLSYPLQSTYNVGIQYNF